MQAHRLGGLLCALTAVAFLLMTGARGDPIVGFGRIAINGSPTSTGFVDVAITPFSSSGVGYLNVAVDWNSNGLGGNSTGNGSLLNPGSGSLSPQTIIGWVRHDTPGIKQKENECAPTSAAQSLYWLQLRRVSRWQTPPNWSRADWLEEVSAEAYAAGWCAVCEHHASSRLPLFDTVYRYTLNACLQRYRQEWRYVLRCRSMEDGHVWGEDLLELSLALARLPEHDRQLLHALFWEGRSETDIAREQGVSVQAISAHKRRLLRNLQEMLG